MNVISDKISSLGKRVSPRYVGTLLVMLFVFALASAALAVPANSARVYKLKQPDGYTFRASQRGDERKHWTRSNEDGYIIVYDRDTKWWDFAVEKDGRYVSSSVHYNKDTTPPRGAARDFVPASTKPDCPLKPRCSEKSSCPTKPCCR